MIIIGLSFPNDKVHVVVGIVQLSPIDPSIFQLYRELQANKVTKYDSEVSYIGFI